MKNKLIPWANCRHLLEIYPPRWMLIKYHDQNCGRNHEQETGEGY